MIGLVHSNLPLVVGNAYDLCIIRIYLLLFSYRPKIKLMGFCVMRLAPVLIHKQVFFFFFLK
jgi:hypothetical protein